MQVGYNLLLQAANFMETHVKIVIILYFIRLVTAAFAFCTGNKLLCLLCSVISNRAVDSASTTVLR